MKKIRCYIDVAAKDKNDAVMKIADEIDRRGGDLNGMFMVQENPFSKEEELIILELARTALADAEVYDTLAYNIDLSDKVLKKLQEKIEAVTNR